MNDITLARSNVQFDRVHELIGELAAWDAGEMAALGIDSDDLLHTHYSDSPATLMAKFTAPGTAFFLCLASDRAVGCAGFSGEPGGAAELCKLYARPDARGRGVGGALLRAVLAGMADHGYRRARLETVTVMTAAAALYRANGFEPCAPFRRVPNGLEAITIFMERPL